MDPAAQKNDASPQASQSTQVPLTVPTYEQQLSSDFRWAMAEGDRYFHENSAVFDALRRIARRLDELQIPYAVIGAMALFAHGLRRFTEDVDILVTRDGLDKIHNELSGLGWLPKHKDSRHLRDTHNQVRVEFLTAGDYPGDGKPKPFAFPDPASVSQAIDGISFVNLPTLVDLKLASGMTGAGRRKDLGDVEELIKVLKLPADFASRLNPYVQAKYQELWRESVQRFIALFQADTAGAPPVTFDDLIAARPDAAEKLWAMQRDGVTIEWEASLPPGQVRLVATDRDVAEKYDFVEESEFWRPNS